MLNVFFTDFDFDLLVMNDNKVYDIMSVLYSVKSVLDIDVTYSDLSEVSKLSDNNIEEFFICSSFMFAKSGKNEIYSQGYNEDGQLGRGFRSKESLIPEKVDYFSYNNTVDGTANF